ncbi:putative dehydrogenase [Mycobacterium sp. BK558]|nr:Gfo/Idh/MocA family oxidoreductase [Mycolicibacterium rufum]RZT19105.1 putative dehydrogenase [Mycobacterium sp. BK558]
MSNSRTDRPLRWGLISTAAIAADVIPGLQRSVKNDLLAVASRDQRSAENFADAYGIPRAYGDYSAMLDDPEIDCVYIPLPNHLHGEWTRRALLAGKHVLCEKPFVAEPAEATELFTLADVCGLHLAEAFMYRHHPKTHALKKVVDSRTLGTVHTIRSWFTYPAEDAMRDIRFQPGMDGGALRDVGSYPVSMCNYLLDAEPTTVSAMAVDTGAVDERFYALLSYPGEIVAVLDCSMRSYSGYGVTVTGTAGSATLACPWYSHVPPDHLEITTQAGVERIVPERVENPYFLETENFADVVVNGADAEIAPDETVRTMRTLARLRQTAIPL